MIQFAAGIEIFLGPSFSLGRPGLLTITVGTSFVGVPVGASSALDRHPIKEEEYTI
jgi:hypothetical protein